MENISAFFTLYHSLSPFNITLGLFYLLNMIVGFVGNFLVIFIAYRNRDMRTTTNYLLTNLAAADFIALFFCSIPLVVDFSNSHITGHGGQFICKVFTGNFLSQWPKSAAFTTLILLATERFFAIVKPFDTRFKLRKDNVRFAIGMVWIMSSLFCLPFIAVSEFNETLRRCLNPWSIEKALSMKPYIILVALAFVGVTCLLIYCYAEILKGIYITKTVCSGQVGVTDPDQLKAKRKLAMISVTVTLNFCVCYAPSVFFQLYLAFNDFKFIEKNYESLYVIYNAVRFILYLASSVNPLLYAFQSSRYRNNLKRTLAQKRSPRVHVYNVRNPKLTTEKQEIELEPRYVLKRDATKNQNVHVT